MAEMVCVSAVPTTRCTGEVTVLPFTPTNSLPVGGSFCFTFQATGGSPTLNYEARVTGVHDVGTLSVAASWSPLDHVLHLQGTVALANVGAVAVAGCGCITPALRLPPPHHNQYAGSQTQSFPSPANGTVDLTGTLVLQPHD